MAKRILTGKTTEIVLFVCVMGLTFHLTFNVIGEVLHQLLSQIIDEAALMAEQLLTASHLPDVLCRLITDGILPGVGAVLSFVPVIGTLFFFLSLLEESGYLAHASRLLDGPMGRLGLSGAAILPVIMGFGCNVPAIMAASSLPGSRQRSVVISMIPFLSCSARMPVYAMFITAFFADHRLLVLTAVYLIGIAAAITLALLMKKIYGQCPACTTGSHLCGLRRPSLKNIWASVCRNCLGFVKKAFTIILLASAAIWFLQSFDASLRMVSDPENSLLASLGMLAAPLFAPLGFGDWRAVSALISGLFAKEAVVSTLAVLTGSGGVTAFVCGATPGSIKTSSAFPSSDVFTLSDAFTPLSAFSFMTFCLLYVPCIAAFAAVKHHLGLKHALSLSAVQMTAAWVVSFLIFQAGTLV